jgi:hypothetical protein
MFKILTCIGFTLYIITLIIILVSIIKDIINYLGDKNEQNDLG